MQAQRCSTTTITLWLISNSFRFENSLFIVFYFTFMLMCVHFFYLLIFYAGVIMNRFSTVGFHVRFNWTGQYCEKNFYWYFLNVLGWGVGWVCVFINVWEYIFMFCGSKAYMRELLPMLRRVIHYESISGCLDNNQSNILDVNGITVCRYI